MKPVVWRDREIPGVDQIQSLDSCFDLHIGNCDYTGFNFSGMARQPLITILRILREWITTQSYRVGNDKKISKMQSKGIPKAYLYRQIVQAKLYIEVNYDKEINLDLISREAAYSKFHFLRLFKGAFGLTPNQFLKETRLVNARKLLVQGISIQDTCWRVGFESISSFSTLFKRKFGTSPTRYVQIRKKFNETSAANPLKFIPGCFAANLIDKK